MLVTILDNLEKTDFDLYNRVVEGFEAKLIKPMQKAEGHVIYCHDENLLESLSWGKPVVCLGEKWNPNLLKDIDISKFENLYVTNNLDEARYIIKQLLTNQPI